MTNPPGDWYNEDQTILPAPQALPVPPQVPRPSQGGQYASQPPQGPQQPPTPPLWRRLRDSCLSALIIVAAAVIVGAVIVIAAIAYQASTDEPELIGSVPVDTTLGTPAGVDNSETVPETSEPPSGGGEVFAVGDLLGIGDWTMVVHQVVDPMPAGTFLPPEEGFRYVEVEIEVSNVSSSEEILSMSSLVCFELLDSQNRVGQHTIAPPTLGGLIDGQVMRGTSRRGGIVFEVPEGAEGLVLRFNCEMMIGGEPVVVAL